MNLALWIATGLLALIALVGGISKSFVPKEKLATHPAGGWVEDFDVKFLKSIGVLELLAAAGLILPAVLDIAPILVPITAICWVLLMLGAIIVHYRYGYTKPIVANIIYLTLALFIAWGRLGPMPFTG